jgi:hypothetical protein
MECKSSSTVKHGVCRFVSFILAILTLGLDFSVCSKHSGWISSRIKSSSADLPVVYESVYACFNKNDGLKRKE